MKPETTTNINGQKFLEKLNKPEVLRLDHLPIRGDGKENRVEIEFLKEGVRQPADGQFFVDLPEDISIHLPGSYVSPDDFLKILGLNRGNGQLRRLLGGDIEDVLRHEESNFSLNVYAGSTNDYAINLTEVAARKDGFTIPDNRISYQKNLWEIVKPVLSHDSVVPPTIHIVEDCLATGDTVMGALAVLYQKTKLHDKIHDRKKVRVDVAVGTAQGILLLKKFAQDNQIDLELNVGYMAFGLSAGKESENGKGLEGANYITYPYQLLGIIDELFNKSISDRIETVGGVIPNASNRHKEDLYVVGDMGDFGRSVYSSFNNQVPWNAYRRDSHGEVEASANIKDTEIYDATTTNVYLANGGYLMRAYRHYLLNNQGYTQQDRNQLSELVFDAKRRFDESTTSFGVLIDKLSINFLIN